MCIAELVCYVMMLVLPQEDGKFTTVSVATDTLAECNEIRKMYIRDYFVKSTAVDLDEIDLDMVPKGICYFTMSI